MRIEVCRGQAGLALYVNDERLAGVRHNGLMETLLSAEINQPIMTDADWSLIVWALSKTVWGDQAEHQHAMRIIEKIGTRRG